jgi:hypothetical protein
MRRAFKPQCESLDLRDVPGSLAVAAFPMPYGPTNALLAAATAAAPTTPEPLPPALLFIHPSWEETYSLLNGLQEAMNALPPAAPPTPTWHEGYWFTCPCPTMPTDPVP